MDGIDNKQASISLVGAGPGDPDLLTIKALRAIQSAEVIIFDNLVSDGIRALFPENCVQVYVGKAKGCHSYTQQEINQLLLEHAAQGKRICRVKGGDSFVFGRGGEEMLLLRKRGYSVDVVPGITAASGCTTYSNIPLTHRGLAQGCTFITAHAEKNLNVEWGALAQLNQTLVIYMGLSKASLISSSLIGAGMSPDTPAAYIEKGCCPEQRTVIGTLSELEALRLQHKIQSPALIVIGQVVKVAEQVEWLEQLNEKALGDGRTISETQQNLKMSA
ncbi:uroporphyrinogen-III C-methyltransferase [Vibrio hangzhouensis]|uniref:uroporphyrinogen-III C-methyltransferase n=1 Tax=Vibrio hangzhouensis TaxID=462991 RepID=A0A1H5YVU9_9VIBR|nr:uroporphyrinogen-III C-methyltransferase [Vibrio hangzhouensis]SEG27376.1 uroporphyrin-III C-methyltransferase [Vibrio hangzhouensis]